MTPFIIQYPTLALHKSQSMNLFRAFCLLFFTIPVYAQTEVPVFPNMTGAALLDAVVDAYKPTTVLEYAEARDTMYGTIYLLDDSVRCVYSGHALYLPPNVDPSSHLFMNSSSNGINAEHTYPRSKGADEDNGNPFSDMHHLFPTRSAVNTSRSNFPFGEIVDSQTGFWFYRDEVLNTVPGANIDLWSERINGRFEPREDHKGNVARAMFYFYTMYEAEALEADPDYFESQRAVLCDWHKQDPVDLLEWERTYQIAGHQDDLPNPFVLDSTLVERCYCVGATSVEDLNLAAVSVYPNPVSNELRIDAVGETAWRIVSLVGRTVAQGTFVDSVAIDFSGMTSTKYT